MGANVGIIYKATNIINGKSYIGKTTQSLKARKASHTTKSKKGNNYYFHNALKKYGFDNFEWEIICENVPLELLSIREIMKIIVNHTHYTEGGYNMTWGGEGTHGYKHTDEARKIIKEKRKLQIFSTEYKINMSKVQTNHFVSEETKRKISDKWTKERLDNLKKELIGNKRASKYGCDSIKNALLLREQGMTFYDISTMLKIPMGTIYTWYKNKNSEVIKNGK